MADRLAGATLDSVTHAPARDTIAAPLADAFRGTYVWAVALLALALVPAALLPRARAHQN